MCENEFRKGDIMSKIINIKEAVEETATVFIGYASAFGKVIARNGQYATVQYGKDPKSVFTGKVVNA